LTRDLIRARPLAAILALVVGLTFLAPPAFAAAPPVPVRPLAAAAAAKVQAAPAAALAQTAQASPAAGSGGKPFFKSTKGVVVLVLMAGAIGWAAVSRNQDAVRSPARK
jgi:hypothetical protein